jgi:hypothetical protein
MKMMPAAWPQEARFYITVEADGRAESTTVLEAQVTSSSARHTATTPPARSCRSRASERVSGVIADVLRFGL